MGSHWPPLASTSMEHLMKRGIADGWYATNTTGAICSGPFSNHSACNAHIEQERADINAYHQGATNLH
jgi:hypothetical protein